MIEIVVLSLRPELPPIYERFGFIEVRREEFTPVRSLRPGYECHGIVMSKKLWAPARGLYFAGSR